MTTIAQQIIAQLPRQAFAMMGATALVDTGEGLQWKVGSNARRVSCLVVKLDQATDTYTVEVWKGRGLSMRLADTHEGVYADALARTIEESTGMYLTLGRTLAIVPRR